MTILLKCTECERTNNMTHLILGVISGIVIYFLMLCFMFWQIPPDLGSLQVYDRTFIFIFGLLFSGIGGMVGHEIWKRWRNNYED